MEMIERVPVLLRLFYALLTSDSKASLSFPCFPSLFSIISSSISLLLIDCMSGTHWKTLTPPVPTFSPPFLLSTDFTPLSNSVQCHALVTMLLMHGY